MKKDPKGYYAVLEVSTTASAEEIKSNYRKIAKQWHPDQNESENALEMFQKISVAYDILKDEKKRLTYDLLSQIYSEKDFPEMFSLKAYLNQDNQKDVSIREVEQCQMIGKIYKYRAKHISQICNYAEARSFVLKVSVFNWLLGWWSLKGFFKNIKALIDNYRKIDKNAQNDLKLHIHNALAYQQDNELEYSASSAIVASQFANSEQKYLLQSFLTELGSVKVKPQKIWNYKSLKLIQLIIPAFIIISAIIYGSSKTIDFSQLYQFSEKTEELDYYREVEYQYGRRGVDDVIVAKIFEIPVDIYNDKLLFHVNQKTKVMIAAGENFDVIRVIDSGTTVRVTGYTPDKIWFRIMLDDGQMGFVRAEVLKKGIKNEIPSGSKIIKN